MGLDNFVETIILEVFMHYSVIESFGNGNPKLVRCGDLGVFGFTDRYPNGHPMLNDIADFPLVICKDTDDVAGIQDWMQSNQIEYPVIAYIEDKKVFKLLHYTW